MSDHDSRYCIHMAMVLSMQKSTYASEHRGGDMTNFMAPLGSDEEECAHAGRDFQSWVRDVATTVAEQNTPDVEMILLKTAEVAFVAGRIFEEQQVIKLAREDSLDL